MDATVQRGSIQFLITMGHANSIVLGLLLAQLAGSGELVVKPTAVGAPLPPVETHGVNVGNEFMPATKSTAHT